MDNEVKKPPLGIMPQDTWREFMYEERYKALCGAITRYNENSYSIPNEWLKELMFLNKELNYEN